MLYELLVHSVRNVVLGWNINLFDIFAFAIQIMISLLFIVLGCKADDFFRFTISDVLHSNTLYIVLFTLLSQIISFDYFFKNLL